LFEFENKKFFSRKINRVSTEAAFILGLKNEKKKRKKERKQWRFGSSTNDVFSHAANSQGIESQWDIKGQQKHQKPTFYPLWNHQSDNKNKMAVIIRCSSCFSSPPSSDHIISPKPHLPAGQCSLSLSLSWVFCFAWAWIMWVMH